MALGKAEKAASRSNTAGVTSTEHHDLHDFRKVIILGNMSYLSQAIAALPLLILSSLLLAGLLLRASAN
jgi:hypothetical protein